jgi:hypothetical protein
MGVTTLLALTAVQGISQIGQGYAQKAEMKYNASLTEGQARLIQVQKDIEKAQYQRMKGKVLSTSMANLGKAGIMPTGSAAAVMIDTQRQIGIDQAIGQYNLEMQKQYKLSEAEAMRRKGKMAVQAGWTNAFTSILQGASNYGSYGGGKQMGGGGVSSRGNVYGSNTPYGTRDMGTYSTWRR